MKKILYANKIAIMLFCFFLIMSNKGFSQTQQDSTIHLKNGYTIKGKIIERKSGYIKVQTKDNSIFDYKFEDVDKVTSANISESETNPEKFSLGIDIGCNSNSFKMSSENTLVDDRLGFNIGASLTYKILKFLSLQTGVYYQEKGCIFKFNQSIDSYYGGTTNFTVQQQINLNYVTLPVNLNLQVGKIVKVFANIGIDASYLIKGNVADKKVTQNSYTGSYPNNYYSYGDEFSKYDIGLNLGGGVKIPLSAKMDLIAQANYNHGFNKVYTNKINYWNSYDYKNKSFGILLGLVYYLHEKF